MRLATAATAAALLAVLGVVGGAAATPSAPATAAALPARLWAVEIRPSVAPAVTASAVAALRRSGVNAILAGPGLRGKALAALRRRTAAGGVPTLVPVRRAGACASGRTAAPCVVLTASLPAASALAARRASALFVAHLTGLGRVGQSPAAGRVVAVVPLGASAPVASWAAKLAAGGTHLAVAASPTSARALRRSAAIVAAARGSGSGPAAGQPTALGPDANLWVDHAGGSCTRSAKPVPYGPGTACGSFDQAYLAASCGDVVRVEGGTYGGQTITGRRSCGGTWTGDTCSACVKILPAQGQKVTLQGDLTAEADYVELIGFDMPNDSWKVTGTNVNHVICRNCNAAGLFYIGSGPMSYISVVGGSIGPMRDVHPQIDGTGLSDALFKGVHFHDITCGDCAAHHVECLQVNGGTRLTFDGDLWVNCGVFDLSLTQYNGAGPPTDVLVQNNFFGAPVDGGVYSFQVNSNARAIVRLTLQYNSSSAPFMLDNVVPLQGAIVRANVAPAPNCRPPGSVTFDHNVWLGGRCSPTDVSVSSLGFVNARAADFHLVNGAAALRRGAPTCPATDFDGQPRPQPAKSTCDAGADER